MKTNSYLGRAENDPDFLQACKELDGEFPGAGPGYSLPGRQGRAAPQKSLIKKIFFHGAFYSVFAAGIGFLFRKYGIGILDCMVYGLSWFLAYSAIELYRLCLGD